MGSETTTAEVSRFVNDHAPDAVGSGLELVISLCDLWSSTNQEIAELTRLFHELEPAKQIVHNTNPLLSGTVRYGSSLVTILSTVWDESCGFRYKVQSEEYDFWVAENIWCCARPHLT